MRTFVAIELDNEIKDSLSTLIRELDTAGRSIRWVKPNGMHLTLKFLGEISQDKITDVESVLGNIAKDYPAFPLSFAGTGTFPLGARVPRIVWVGIGENETLRTIQTRVENELQKIHFPREKRQYHPHLTLGRVKGPHNLETVLKTLSQYKEADFGGMMVTKISLFKSTLKPSGAEYTILSEYRLE